MGFTTRNLHLDRLGTHPRVGKPEHGALHKPIHPSVAYGYDQAQDLADAFQGKIMGYAYARQANPTVEALEHKVNLMEDGLGTVLFASGMSAIAALECLLQAGDHVVATSYLFGNTNSLFQSWARHGIEVSFVDPRNAQNVKEALRPNTKLVFVETIANPVTQIADLAAIGEICQESKLIYVVDNTLTTPWGYQPKIHGASLVVNALSKAMGGHGVALGGSLTDTGLYDWSQYSGIWDMFRKGDSKQWGLVQLRKKGLRDGGSALSASAAHTISLGLDTLALRLERACANAQKVAEFLESHPKVSKVYYPGLKSHSEFERAQNWFKAPAQLMSVELKEGLSPFEFLDKLKYVVSSSNIADVRSLGIPVAHTIFFEMGPERRASMGIADSLVRLSIGIEDSDDLLEDFAQALN